MSAGTRRQVLQGIKANHAHHAGLWLDKFLEDQQRGTPGGSAAEEKDTARHRLMAGATTIPLPGAYHNFFARWQTALDALPGSVIRRHAQATGRVIIGLGAESPSETAITLHHTFGVPYLPGSALKGLAAFYARNYLEDTGWRWDAEKQPGLAYQTLFGDTTQAGCVTFYDAYYVPGSAPGDRMIFTDTITVHHQAYYDGGSAAPADWDKPIPVPFVSATGAYLVALGGNDAAWVDAGLAILALALAELGIGAKTSSGYGRMTLVELAQGSVPPPRSSAQAASATQKPIASAPGTRQRGMVTDVKGAYAFIRPEGDGARVFVHESALATKDRPLRAGQVVEYTLGPGRQPGQVQAQDVVVVSRAG